MNYLNNTIISYFYSLFAESMFLCCGKPKTKEYFPELAARDYFDLGEQPKVLNAGVHRVGVIDMAGQKYVIGLVVNRGDGDKLCPFFVPTTVEHAEVDRIKIRVRAEYQKADVYQPIGKGETSLRGLFFKRYPPMAREEANMPNPYFKVDKFEVSENPSVLNTHQNFDNTLTNYPAGHPM